MMNSMEWDSYDTLTVMTKDGDRHKHMYMNRHTSTKTQMMGKTYETFTYPLHGKVMNWQWLQFPLYIFLPLYKQTRISMLSTEAWNDCIGDESIYSNSKFPIGNSDPIQHLYVCIFCSITGVSNLLSTGQLQLTTHNHLAWSHLT